MTLAWLNRLLVTIIILWGSTAIAQTPQPEDAAISIAKANLSLVRYSPRMTKLGKPFSSSRARATGHYGIVKISGILGTNGKLTKLRIAESGKSALLDNAALESAKHSKFSKALDESGVQYPVWITVQIETDGRYLPEGAEWDVKFYRKDYSCVEFTGDMDWWRSAWPDRKWNENKFYAMIQHVRILSLQRSFWQDHKNAQKLNRDMQKSRDELATSWNSKIELCRKQPDARLIDVLKPDGDLLVAEKKAAR